MADGAGLTAALPNARQALRAYGDHSSGLAKYNFGDRRGNLLAEETVGPAVLSLPVGPGGEFVWRRRVTQFGGTAAHDEAEHNLRLAILSIVRVSH